MLKYFSSQTFIYFAKVTYIWTYSRWTNLWNIYTMIRWKGGHISIQKRKINNFKIQNILLIIKLRLNHVMSFIMDKSKSRNGASVSVYSFVTIEYLC